MELVSSYKTYRNRYDTAYQFCKSSTVNSTDTSNIDENAILGGCGISSAETGTVKNSSSSSSGGWLADLKAAIANMGNALFGISTSSDDENSSEVDSSTYGEEMQFADKTAEEIYPQFFSQPTIHSLLFKQEQPLFISSISIYASIEH